MNFSYLLLRRIVLDIWNETQGSPCPVTVQQTGPQTPNIPRLVCFLWFLMYATSACNPTTSNLVATALVLYSAANPVPPTGQSHFALRNAFESITQKRISVERSDKCTNNWSCWMSSHFNLYNYNYSNVLLHIEKVAWLCHYWQVNCKWKPEEGYL